MGKQKSKATQQHATVSLVELRKIREINQVPLAGALNIAQPTLSRMEKREDMLVSTLRQYVAALGGELKLVAVFPEGVVEISLG